MSASLAALDLQKPSPLISQAPSYYPQPSSSSTTTFVPTSHSAPQVNLTPQLQHQPQPQSLHRPGVALPYPNQFHPTSYNNMVSASILQQALPSFVPSSPLPAASSSSSSSSSSFSPTTTTTNFSPKPLPKPPTLSAPSSTSTSMNAQVPYQQSSSSTAAASSSSLLSPHPRPILQSSDPLRGTFQHPPQQPQTSPIVRSNGELEARRAINPHTNGTSPMSFLPIDGASLNSIPLVRSPHPLLIFLLLLCPKPLRSSIAAIPIARRSMLLLLSFSPSRCEARSAGLVSIEKAKSTAKKNRKKWCNNSLISPIVDHHVLF